ASYGIGQNRICDAQRRRSTLLQAVDCGRAGAPTGVAGSRNDGVGCNRVVEQCDAAVQVENRAAESRAAVAGGGTAAAAGAARGSVLGQSAIGDGDVPATVE